jgi:hypothetical protein
VIGAPLAHVGGVPIEETVASFGPALLVALGAVAAKLRARFPRMRPRAASRGSRAQGAPAAPR